MQGYKHIINRKPPGRLPLFPDPYPGESFYSVLCRYHVRSGNISDWYTSNQLFGYNSSLTSTLLTPFHLEMVKHWFPSHPGVNAEKMLHQNTAYNLYAINAIPGELERIQDVVAGRRTTESFPRWMHPRIINPAGYLRYCPECAAEQIKLYGEPYWQVLPQVDEAEYCPRHHIRIKNSPVPLKNIGFHYHPASSVLTTQLLRDSRHSSDHEWEILFDKEKTFFVKLADSIDWLLRNGHLYAGNKNLVQTYNKISGMPGNRSWFELSKRVLWETFARISHDTHLYSYLEYKNPRQVGGTALYLYSLRICSHVMIMTALCGNPKAFYEQ